MSITDLGPALQLRYLITDKGKAVAVFADERKANAYVLQDRIARKKNGI